MRRILYLIPDLEYRGVNQLVSTLAAGLPVEGFFTSVCALGRLGPVAEQLRAARVPCTACSGRGWMDGNPLRRLAGQLRAFRPDILHVWGMASLRLAWLTLSVVGTTPPCQLVATGCLPDARLGLAWLDRWLLGKAHRIVACGPTEASAYRALGIPSTRLAVAPRGTALPSPAGPFTASVVPELARIVLCLGPFERNKGFKTAIWALDILRYLYPDLHLVAVGAGPEIAQLEQFARSIRVAEFVHFVGPVADVSSWMTRAEVVWAGGGTLTALEAMAAGRPVVADRHPALAELVDDRISGFLVAPHDPVALARHTRLLLENKRLCREHGQAGRDLVARSHTARHLVEQYARVYNLPAVEPLDSAVPLAA